MDSYSVYKTMSEYCQRLDDGRLEALADLFASNAVLNIPAFKIHVEGREAIRTQYGQMIDPGMKGTHSVFNPVIEVTGDSASAFFDFVWIDLGGAPKITNVGRYSPRFVKESDRWRFKELNIEIRSQPAQGT